MIERRLLADDVRHPQRHVAELVRGVEGGLEHGVAARPGDGSRFVVGRSVIALAGADVDAAAAADLHLDLAEGAVARGVRGVVADQVVRARLVGDPAQPAGEVVRVSHGEPAAVRGERDRALLRLRLLGEREAEVLRGQRRAVFRGERVGQALEAAAVQEVDGRVDPSRRIDDLLELGQVGVVHEALGDEDDRLPAPHGGEGSDRALQRPERLVVPRRRLVVDLGRARGDDRVLDRHHVPHVLALLGHGLDPVRLEPALDAVEDGVVAEHVDPHGLVVGQPVAPRLRQDPSLEPLQQVEQLAAARIHPGRPPHAAARRDERHAVALAGLGAQELRDRRLRLLGRPGAEVHVVEGDHERASALLFGVGVRRQAGGRGYGRGRGGGGRRGRRDLEQVE